jgi:transcriptional regulator with XRE-family HTH domain
MATAGYDSRMTTTPLADTIRAAIQQGELSAYAVAKRAGVATQVVSRWLNGQRDITLATADKIADSLGIKAFPISPKKLPKKP